MAKKPRNPDEKGPTPKLAPGDSFVPDPPVKPQPGRPSVYTQAAADEILQRLTHGETLRQICKSDHLPGEGTVRMWVTDDREGFAAKYMRARDIGLDAMADCALDISDTPEMGKKIKTTGSGETAEVEVTEADMIEHRRLRTETRKWYLSKAAPKRYGDRVQHEHSGGITLEAMVLGSMKPKDEEPKT